MTRRFAAIRVALRALWIHKGRSFLTSLGIVIGVGSVIAVFFGFYPAWKASRLDPFEALRYE